MKILVRLASFAVGLSLFLCSTGLRAQVLPKAPDKATMWDEYGLIGGCDHSARLDNVAIMVQNNPRLEGYLVYYGPESASEPTFGQIKNYLVNSRGLSEERWKTIYAGPNSDPREPRIQLWLAPQGAPPPELVKYESKVETFNGLFVEQKRWESIYFGEGELTGPPVPGVAVPTFIDMLKQQKGTLAYLVTFSGTESAPGSWRRVARQESEELQANGITSDRIKTIYGGIDKKSNETRVQFWILPENEPPPVADAGPELAPTNTRQIGTFGDYELGDERGERLAFNVLLDGLRLSDDLRVCIIVRLEQKATDEGVDEAEETEVETELEAAQQEEALVTDVTAMPGEITEPAPADVLKLVDKWKFELSDKYKIRHDRIIVLFSKAREHEGNSLEAWMVPRGGHLPDPEAEPVEETVDDAKPIEQGKDNGEIKPQKNNQPS